MKTVLVFLIAMAGFFGSVAWAQGPAAHAAAVAALPTSAKAAEPDHPTAHHGAAKSHPAKPQSRGRAVPAQARQPVVMPEFGSGQATDRPSVMCACVTLDGRA